MSFEVSQSKLKIWRRCRKAYDYKYIQELTKKHKPMPFLRGDIVHQMLEAHYKGQGPWKVFNKLIKENERILRIHAEDYGDMKTNLGNLMRGYFKFYKGEDLEPVDIEHEFRVELTKGIYVNGKIDMIAKSQNMLWLGEHKVHNTIPTSGMVPVANIQSPLYLWAYMKETGKKLDGVLWNYLLGKPLPIPKTLKDGSMSRRVTSTTWDVYRKALKEAGLKPKDYLDIKEKLEGNEALIYQRKIIPTNPDIINSVVEDFTTTAIEMKKLGGKDTTRNLSWDCDRCEFKSLCLAQLQGLDDNYILKSDFKRRKKDEKSKNQKPSHIQKD